MQLAIAALDAEAPPIVLKDLPRFEFLRAINGVSEIAQSRLFEPTAAVFADNDHLGRISLACPTLESVTGAITVTPVTQPFDAALTTALRDGNEIRHASASEQAQHRDRTEAFVEIRAFDP